MSTDVKNFNWHSLHFRMLEADSQLPSMQEAVNDLIRRYPNQQPEDYARAVQYRGCRLADLFDTVSDAMGALEAMANLSPADQRQADFNRIKIDAEQAFEEAQYQLDELTKDYRTLIELVEDVAPNSAEPTNLTVISQAIGTMRSQILEVERRFEKIFKQTT